MVAASLPQVEAELLDSRFPLDADGPSVLARLAAIESLISNVVASWHMLPGVLYERRSNRVYFERPVGVTVLDDKTEEPLGPAKLAAGRDISLHGISFMHLHPLPYRKVAISLAADDGPFMSFVACLHWCRFTREGCYQSGGKFLKTIDLPDMDRLTWRDLSEM